MRRSKYENKSKQASAFYRDLARRTRRPLQARLYSLTEVATLWHVSRQTAYAIAIAEGNTAGGVLRWIDKRTANKYADVFEEKRRTVPLTVATAYVNHKYGTRFSRYKLARAAAAGPLAFSTIRGRRRYSFSWLTEWAETGLGLKPIRSGLLANG